MAELGSNDGHHGSTAVMPTTVTTAAEDQQSRCYFTTIPGELRNRIYDLVFEINVGTDTNEIPDITELEEAYVTDLFNADPPSRALVTVNRQIYCESNDFYRQAYQTYWEGTRFYVGAPASTAVPSMLGLGDGDLAHVQHIVVRCRDPREDCFLLKGRVWRILLVRHTAVRTESRFMVVPKDVNAHDLVDTTETRHVLVDYLHGRTQIAHVMDEHSVELETFRQNIGSQSLSKYELAAILKWASS